MQNLVQTLNKKKNQNYDFEQSQHGQLAFRCDHKQKKS